MTRRRLLTALVAGWVAATPLAAWAVPVAGTAAPVPSYQQCYDAAPAGATNVAAACRGLAKLGQDASALCRRLIGDDPSCVTPFAPPVIRKEIDAYQRSWTHGALTLQRALDDGLPLRAAQWLGTHNSFNSLPDDSNDPPPGLSQLDSNQQLSMVDQLRSDIRSLEVDAHWTLDPHTGANEVRLCHAESGGYGCTAEGTLAEGLAPIAAWLAVHPKAVLFLYVDDDLQNHDGYEAAAAVIRHAFGDRIYLPPVTEPGACHPLDLDLTRDAVRRAGKQVLVWSSCESTSGASSWNDLVYSDGGKFEQTTATYAGYPRCDGPAAQARYGSTFVRYYEDSTFLSALAAPDGHHIDTPMAANMAGCGVNLVGFDQLLPGDSRLAASVWSWARREPAATGSCATESADDGRFRAAPCTGRHPVACLATDGRWTVSTPAVPRQVAAERCSSHQTTFAVPRSGREAAALRLALERSGAEDAWLAYDKKGSGWSPGDGR